jgi:hypothetical protein
MTHQIATVVPGPTPPKTLACQAIILYIYAEEMKEKKITNQYK